MRNACVPQSKGTPRIAAFAPAAEIAQGAPMKPLPALKSSASARSLAFPVMRFSSNAAEEVESGQRMHLRDGDQFIGEHIFVRPAHAEGRAAEHDARHAEHPVKAGVGRADAHI